MEYTIQKLGSIAGISTRTLRYYDEIGLLKPARVNSSGYRIYGSDEVNKLQQILFFRELGVGLESIKEIIEAPAFDRTAALKEHREKLLTKRKQIDLMVVNIDKTLAESEGRINMSDNEKFEGLKERLINENEEKYGAEIRAKYGDETVDKSNNRFKGLTKEQYEEMEELGQKVLDSLNESMELGDPSSEAAQNTADLHRQWLNYTWGNYSKEAHAGLAQMYVNDERFKAYYDKVRPGAAEFLRDAIFVYTGTKK